MKILLINPWIYDFTAYDLWMRPVGLLYIASVLKREGIDIDFIDCLDRYDPRLLKFQNLEKPKGKKDGRGEFYKEEIKKPDILNNVNRKYSRYGFTEEIFISKLNSVEKPDYVFFTSMMIYWYPGVRRIIEIIKDKFPASVTVLGGIYPTLMYEHSRENTGADIVFKGESENKILDFLEDDHPGYQRKYNYNSIDDFPYIDLDFYHKNIFVPLLTSRGCPYKCSFCASGILFPGFIQRSIDLVFDELQYQYRKYKARNLVFFDDALLVNREKHINILLEKIIGSNMILKIHTPNGIHPAHIDLETAKLMKKSGFDTLRLSLESIDTERIKNMNGKVSPDSFSNAVDHLEKSGFNRKKLESYIIMGLPEQTPEEVLQTMIFAAGNGVKIRLASFSPIPGTRDFEKAIKSGLIDKDIDPLLLNSSVFPLQRKGFTKTDFENIKKIAIMLNYSVDLGINITRNKKFIDALYGFRYLEKKN
ncbi:B12-binding domain-containing radical SAM protein [candidate division KSB1 bacterium]